MQNNLPTTYKKNENSRMSNITLNYRPPAEAVEFLRVNKNPQHVGGHGCLSVVIVVCCQVEVSATS